jgi:hypothetical protein
MDAYRTLRIYGSRQPDTKYSVMVNGELVDNGQDELFSFITNTKVHGSYNVVINVERGGITIDNCTATYPALINQVEGTATFNQPIREPIAVIENKSIKTLPFEISINAGESFAYEHLMLNGPTRLVIRAEMQDLFPGINVYIGDFILNEFSKGILDVQAEYEYKKHPNEFTVENEEKLKEIVLNAVLKNTGMKKHLL